MKLQMRHETRSTLTSADARARCLVPDINMYVNITWGAAEPHSSQPRIDFLPLWAKHTRSPCAAPNETSLDSNFKDNTNTTSGRRNSTFRTSTMQDVVDQQRVQHEPASLHVHLKTSTSLDKYPGKILVSPLVRSYHSLHYSQRTCPESCRRVTRGPIRQAIRRVIRRATRRATDQ